MQILSWLVGNRELIKVIYALTVVLICAIITVKSDRLFRLSTHTGIRYFRNAFFFYGVAFVIRYLIRFDIIINNYHLLLKGFFEFFLVMAGFFLLYSLLWKKIEHTKENYTSSLFNTKISIFYVMALMVVLLDGLWNTYYFLFLSQAIIFIFAFAISFNNYKEKGRSRKFLKFYAIAMFLALVAWILNAFAALVLHWHPAVLVAIYGLNIIMFLLFLYGIINVTKKN